nr:MAG TPA: hypothetical protein [Myoviridae sp. ctTfa5]
MLHLSVIPFIQQNKKIKTPSLMGLLFSFSP